MGDQVRVVTEGGSGELFYHCAGRSGGIVIAVDTVCFGGIRVRREDEKETWREDLLERREKRF